MSVRINGGRSLRVAAGVALLLSLCAGVPRRTAAQAIPPATNATGDLQLVPVQGNVHLLVGAGTNITVQMGKEGVLLVDTGPAAMSDRIMAVIRQATRVPIRYLVSTTMDAEHTGGNEKIGQAGRWFTAVTADDPTPAHIIGHENMAQRMVAEGVVSLATVPTLPYFTKRKEVLFNDEAVQVIHAGPGRTDADSFVYFRRSDVISTGDIFLTEAFPVIDEKHGGTIDGIIANLNEVIDIAVPNQIQEAGTLIIPGHGRICDEYDVVNYRDMLVIIRDRIKFYIKQGKTLAQIKAAKPALDYEVRFGATSGPWTTDNFIEAIYRQVGGK